MIGFLLPTGVLVEPAADGALVGPLPAAVVFAADAGFFAAEVAGVVPGALDGVEAGALGAPEAGAFVVLAGVFAGVLVVLAGVFAGVFVVLAGVFVAVAAGFLGVCFAPPAAPLFGASLSTMLILFMPSGQLRQRSSCHVEFPAYIDEGQRLQLGRCF